MTQTQTMGRSYIHGDRQYGDLENPSLFIPKEEIRLTNNHTVTVRITQQ